MTATELLYQLTHPSPLHCTSRILSLGSTTGKSNSDNTDRSEVQVVLDRTAFYAQGGGQPSDVGHLLLIPSGRKLAVKSVRMSPDGEQQVVHYCTKEGPSENDNADEWRIGAEVECEVDKDRRLLHSMLHSAGHVLDAAVERAGVRGHPSKAYHFADGPYVEYSIVPPATSSPSDTKNDSKLSVEVLQREIDKIIDEDLPIRMQRLDRADVPPAILASVPEKASTVRLIDIDGFASNPCGGTHLERTGQLKGLFRVKKLVIKGEKARISYAITY